MQPVDMIPSKTSIWKCFLAKQGIKSANITPFAVLHDGGRLCSIIHLFNKHLMYDSCAYTLLVLCVLSVRKRHRHFSYSSKLVDQEVRGEKPKCYGRRWLQCGVKSYAGRNSRYQGRPSFQRTPYQE